jgi:hypothetical protein
MSVNVFIGGGAGPLVHPKKKGWWCAVGRNDMTE